MSPASPIDVVRERYDHCFGCGRANPIGLHLDGFERSDTKVRARFSPRPDYRGFSDVLHGGIVAAALDEILAWTAVLVEGVMVMTAKLDLRYRKPARATGEFLVEGELNERRGRRLMLSGRLLDGDVVVAEATGLFLAIEDLSIGSPIP